MPENPKPNVVELPGIQGPGVAPVSIPLINKLVAKYVHERDKRCAMTPREIAAKTELIDAMHENADKLGRDKSGALTYRHEDMVITLHPGKETLKVKSIDDDE